jgi:DNA-binding MarR family transcriptional regulator
MAGSKGSSSPRVRDWPQVRAFRALLKANAKLAEDHRRYLSETHDLVITEFDMIAALGNTEGLRMSDLAGAMITTPGNVTRVALSLEKRGLVVRERAPHSDREVLARLTGKGEEFFKKHFYEVASFTKGLLDSRLTTPEQIQLATLLEKI